MRKMLITIIFIAIVGALLWYFGRHVRIELTPTPTPPPLRSQSGNIIVTEPLAGATVGLPLTIKGSARVFESQFSFRVKDADGTILVEGQGVAHAPDAGQFGLFEIKTFYAQPKGTHGTIEVFDYSAKDGSEIDKVIIPVTFVIGTTTATPTPSLKKTK